MRRLLRVWDAIIDEVTGTRPAGLPLSAGTYLVLAALNRVVAPCSKLAFADWWKTTAADRFTKIPASALNHRRFWDAMDAVTVEQLEEISRRIAARMVDLSGLDCSPVALDMTNFATFIDTGNGKAPIAQRGKAKQKRTDPRIFGPGLVVTRDGGIPLTWHARPGDKPDVTQFATMTGQLRDQYAAACAAAGQQPAALKPGSVPASHCPDLTALRATARSVVDEGRFGGLTAFDTRREVYGTERRTILTHSPELQAGQAAGFTGTTLAEAGKKLDELAAVLARGNTRRPRDKVEAQIEAITRKPRVRLVVTWHLTGEQPPGLRLAWGIDKAARAALEDELPGKHVLVTGHDGWPVAEVAAGYRSQSEAEFGFRQLKDPRVVSFSPESHWTEHNIRVHMSTCVLALKIAQLTRRETKRAGLHLSVRELLSKLAAIEETVLIYPSTGGRPKARRMTTELAGDQQKLYEIFEPGRRAPRS
ncbi:MAG TPA: hypothetical protein VLW50_14620 [Streptosporangiaceae bacterium]|nr:hypothetical protein [Streptosporangiaceae bacterium]